MGLCIFCCTWAQSIESQVTSLPTARPKIMVIPYTMQGEDIRTVLENDVNKRIALTKIKEAFDQRGYTTVDFFAKLKALSKATALDYDYTTVWCRCLCRSGNKPVGISFWQCHESI